MITTHAYRARHRSQRGFTLIELIVATAITALIALTLGEAVSLSVRMIGPAQGQQVASSSLLEAERQFGTDVSRADCVTTSGSCPALGSVPSVCAGGALCVAWCDGSSIQGASYSLNALQQLVRQDNSGSYLVVAREVQSLNFDDSIPTGSSSPQLTVTLKAGALRPQSATFTSRSLVTGAAACP
jgi:prepilin-type N-terminal cleavage/methylation domain-containing protein